MSGYEVERFEDRELTPSVAPLARDVAPCRSGRESLERPDQQQMGTVRPRRWLRGLLGGVLASALAVAAVGLVVSVRSALDGRDRRVPAAPSPSVFPLPHVAAATPSARLRPFVAAPSLPVRPVVAAPSPPPPPPPVTVSTGIVRFMRVGDHHRVYIDGTSIGATSVIVSCGPHTIQIGSAGRARSVDVPCGGQTVIDH